eukprot:464062-Pleurochrysis_carterae.AAC.1
MVTAKITRPEQEKDGESSVERKGAACVDMPFIRLEPCGELDLPRALRTRAQLSSATMSPSRSVSSACRVCASSAASLSPRRCSTTP